MRDSIKSNHPGEPCRYCDVTTLDGVHTVTHCMNRMLDQKNEMQRLLAIPSCVLRRLQAEQREWVARNFGSDRPTWQPLMGAVEEIGELAHAHLKEAQGIRMTENHKENAKDAVGDITIYLSDYCQSRGWNYAAIVAEVWDRVKRRDWKANPGDGEERRDDS